MNGRKTRWRRSSISPSCGCWPTATIRSGEIHKACERSYYRNQFKNCLAIGQLHALMYRDLAQHFEQVNVLYLSGNHGRRTPKKDYYGANDNWDYLIAEIARLHCREIDNVHFQIPDAWSANVNINGVGFNICARRRLPQQSWAFRGTGWFAGKRA